MEHFMDRYTIIAGLLILAVVSIFILAIKDRAFSKPCPACRERVKSAARKCRFCGHLFSVAASLFFLLISVVPVFSSQAYDEQLKKRVSSVWKKPEGSDGFSATVRFALDRAGRLTELSISSSSGSVGFDESLLEAFRRAAPFPPLSASIAADYSSAVELIFKSTRPEATAEAPKVFGPQLEPQSPAVAPEQKPQPPKTSPSPKRKAPPKPKGAEI